MRESTEKFFKVGLWMAVVVFVFRYLVIPKIFEGLIATSSYDIFGCVGEAIGIAAIVMSIYERVLWRFNPLEHTPRISGEYEGRIKYQYDGGGSKTIKASVSQTFLSIKISMSTNEVTSRSTSCTLFEDSGEMVLLYNYITNPKSQYSTINPIAYGTCRFSLSRKGELSGTYWTSRATIGDITLKRK
jgi:hypothetical protein